MKIKTIKAAIILAMVAVTGLCACSSKSRENKEEASSDGKSIICYFSASGVTAKA